MSAASGKLLPNDQAHQVTDMSVVCTGQGQVTSTFRATTWLRLTFVFLLRGGGAAPEPGESTP